MRDYRDWRRQWAEFRRQREELAELLGLVIILIVTSGKEFLRDVIPFGQGARGILNNLLKSPFRIP